MRIRSRRFGVVLLVLLLICALSGVAAGRAAQRDLPSVRSLENWKPPTVTQIYAADGSMISMLGADKRILLKYDEIPKSFIDGLVSTEDSRFYSHFGVDPLGVLRALGANLKELRFGAQGASTITMQLARSLFLTPDKTMKRKLQEAMLAFEIERTYSKQEILTFYCNQVYMGPRRYGVESAAQYYLGKTAREMTLDETALLVGIIQNPAALSPFSHPDRALARRNHVLDRMVEEEVISREQADEAARKPLKLTSRGLDEPHGSYFIEEVRRRLVEKYGEETLYREGLKVQTTLDPDLQRAASDALTRGLQSLQQRRGWQRSFRNVLKEGRSLSDYRDPSWSPQVAIGSVAKALVISVKSAYAILRVGSERLVLEGKDMEWSGRTSPSAIFKPGDLVPVRILQRTATGDLSGKVEPPVEMEGAVVVIEPSTGEVRALVGGYDFERSEFNRAIQARRQPGSAFKAFVVTAAIARGITPSERLVDAPTVFLAPGAPEPYQPENYYREYGGLVTLRETLEESRNIASVRLLGKVGPGPVIEQARVMGISSPLSPYPSLALGAFEVSPLEMTAAFAALPNKGVWIEPHMIRSVEDLKGSVLEAVHPLTREAMSPPVAYVVTNLLRGVIQSGTAQKARELGRDLAGKTGTTDDYTDAWFIGFSPSLACGVWVGMDKKQTLGKGEAGAKAALPVWIDIMSKALAKHSPGPFEQPPGVTVEDIDRRTGLRPTPESGCPPDQIIQEAFLEGTDVQQNCSPVEHYRLSLPYFLQNFPVNEKNELAPDVGELASLLSRDRVTLQLARDARELHVGYQGQSLTIPLALTETQRSELLRLLAAPTAEPETTWFGVDGRPAEVITFPN